MKRKLFLLLCTFLTMIGVQAQSYDVTSKYLTNPSFETGDMTGWTTLNQGSAVDPTTLSDCGAREVASYPLTNSDGDYIMNYYGWSWSWNASENGIRQTIHDLPAGNYRVEAVLGGWKDWDMHLIANGESQTQTMTADNTGVLFSVDITLASSGDLNITAKTTHTGHNAWEACFIKADKFKLYRMVDDVTNKYITNAGFDACTAETSDVAAKTKKDYSSVGWTNVASGDFSTIAVTAYGGGKKLANSTTPATKKDGTTVSGNTLGIIAGWGDEVKIQSEDITLPAGAYTLSVDHYLTSDGNYNSSSSRLGFVTTSNSYLVSSTTFTASKWTTETVEFILTESTTGKIQLGLKGTGSVGSGAPAVFYDDVTLTYSPFADAEDYAALNEGISNIEGKAWGFDAGEYAPYNNTDVLEKLAEAKAINQEGRNSQALVLTLATALNNPTLNANEEEVNAIWDASFEYSYSTSGNVKPIGWTGPGNHDNATDVRWMWNVGSNAGLAATSSSKALFTKFGAYYGKQNKYTLPLNENTYYTISFVYGGWSDCKKNGYVEVRDPASANVALTATNLPLDETDGNTNKDHWKNFKATFKTNSAGNYELGILHTGGNTQSQYAYGDFSLVKATAEEIKPFLNAEISKANATYNSGANVGTGVFQIPDEAGTTFNGAISTAQAVYNNGSATADEFSAAIDALKDAEEAYANATLNAPADGVQYRLKNVSGADWANKYYRLYPNAGQPNGGYSVSCDNDAKVYLAQAWKFTAASGTNCYTLSMTDADGETRYLCTNKKGYDQGSATQIRTTTEAGKALVVKVIATNTANVWNLQNTEDNSYIGGQDAGMYSNSQNYSMLIEAGEKAAPKATIVDGSNWATFMSPFAVSLDDLKGVDAAYTAENNDGAIRTVAVEDNTIPANTPVLLYRESKSGKFEKELSGWGTAAQSTYTVGLLTGSYELADIPYHAETAKNNYVLQMQGGVVAFYNVTKTGLIVGAYRAYLTMPEESEARAVLFFPENPTGINAVKAADAETGGYLKDGKYLIGNKIVLLKNGVKYDANGKKLN